MTDLLEQAAAWLDEQRQEHLVGPVTYRRATSTVDVVATVGQTMFRTDDPGSGASIIVTSRDYLLRTDALVLDGAPTLPQRGDKIEEAVNGKTYVHEVLAPNGEPEWRYSDPFRKTLRIHTKEVEVTSPGS